MTTRTLGLHRVVKTQPEKIYRALLDAVAVAK